MRTRDYLSQLWRAQPGTYALELGLRTFFSLTFQAEGLLTRAFFDYLAGSASAGLNLWSMVALLVGARLSRIGILFWGIALTEQARTLAAGLLQRNMLERVLAMPGARALPETAGEAISRFRDDANEVGEFLSDSLHVLGLALFSVIALFVMLAIDPLITVVVFAPIVGVVALAQLARPRIEAYRRASRDATGRITEAIAEMFGGAQAVQIGRAEERVVAHFERLGDVRRVATVRDKVFTEVLNSVWTNAVSVGTGVILLLAAQSIRSGEFTIGDFALFVYYLGFVVELPRQVGATMARYRQAEVSLARMQALMQGAPPADLVRRDTLYYGQAPPQPSAPAAIGAGRLEALEAVGLTYRHPVGDRGIEDVSLRLRRGQFVVVTGRIGAGKTTLLRALLGLLPAERGEIRWNGLVVEEPAEFFVPPRSAYTAQVPRLFSETLRENILGGVPESTVDLGGAIRGAVLESDLAAMEHGLDTLVGPRGVRLSGGQTQRAAAARMLAREAELLVFDDLSSALDVHTERLLWERLGARDDTTFLVVSHRRAALRRADHVILLVDGRVEDEGGLDELLGRCEEMRRLWRSEAEHPSLTGA
jgi:ATP-binding cassette subfamily B protein